MATTPSEITNPAPATPAVDDPSAHLLHRLGTRWDDFVAALSGVNFYIELSMDIFAIALALMAGRWLTGYIQRRVADSAPKLFDAEFVNRLLPLLSPLLTLVSLWVAEIIAILFDIGGGFTDGIFQIYYAYFLARCVLLIIKSRPVAYTVVAAIAVNALLHSLRLAKSTSAFLDSLAFDAGKYHITALHLVHGVVIFVVVFWVAGILSRTLENYLRRTTALSHSSRELAVKFFRLFIYLIAIVITLSSIGIDLTAFAVFGGALGVGVGLGLQKLTSNFVSGVTMLMEKSLKIGDLIEVAGNTGWVRQLNIRYALIETFDGREILIPNEELVSTRVINWTHSTTLARVEIGVVIDFSSDAEIAHKLLLEAASEHALSLKDPTPSCWLKEFTPGGVSFTLNFWIPDITKGRAGPQSDVQFAILRKFNQAGIHLAKAAG